VNVWSGVGASMAILRRESLGTLRGWRAGIAAILTCALATYLLLDQWPPPETDIRRIEGTPVRILTLISWVLLGAGYIALPGLASNAILGERQQQTFDLLKLSLIPSMWIVIAKLLNCVCYFLLLVAAVIPIIAATFYLVGLDIRQFVSILALLVLHAVVCSAAGLAASAFCKRPFSAILLAYLLVAIISGAPAVLAFDDVSRGSFGPASLMCPAIAILSVLQSDITSTEYMYAVAFQPILFIVFFVLTILLVRRPERVAQEDDAKILDDPAILVARRKQFPFYLIDPLRRRPDIPDGKNPMRIKELRWGLLGREARMIRIWYVTTTIMFFTGIFMFTEVPYWVMLQFGALVMIAPAFIASAVSKEFEEGNMDLMRLTLLDGRELLSGKLWAGALSLSPFLLGLLFGSIPMFIYHVIMGGDLLFVGASTVLRFYPTFLSFSMFVLATGLLCSVICRRTVTATLASYFVASVVILAAPLTMLLMRSDTNDAALLGAFLTPVGFVLKNPDRQLGEFALADGSLIVLQWFVLISLSLIAIRIAELIFVHGRMQDR